MTVCISLYIPTRKAMGDIYIRIFLLSFLLLLYYFGEGRCREHGTTTQSEHCPSTLHCQPICFCVDALAVSEYHQYHLQPVILFTKSQIKLLQSRVVLIAPGDSRGCGYRRPALVFCWPLPALTAHRCLDSCRVVCTDMAFSSFAIKRIR